MLNKIFPLEEKTINTDNQIPSRKVNTAKTKPLIPGQEYDRAKPDLSKNAEAQFAAFSLPTRSKVIEMAQ